jgi:hypothetical protein
VQKETSTRILTSGSSSNSNEEEEKEEVKNIPSPKDLLLLVRTALTCPGHATTNQKQYQRWGGYLG